MENGLLLRLKSQDLEFYTCAAVQLNANHVPHLQNILRICCHFILWGVCESVCFTVFASASLLGQTAILNVREKSVSGMPSTLRSPQWRERVVVCRHWRELAMRASGCPSTSRNTPGFGTATAAAAAAASASPLPSATHQSHHHQRALPLTMDPAQHCPRHRLGSLLQQRAPEEALQQLEGGKAEVVALQLQQDSQGKKAEVVALHNEKDLQLQSNKAVAAGVASLQMTTMKLQQQQQRCQDGLRLAILWE